MLDTESGVLANDAALRVNEDLERRKKVEAMIKALTGAESSLAARIGQREQSRALQGLAGQEARMRNVNPALAAVLASRAAPGVGLDVAEKTGQNMANEQSALKDAVLASALSRGNVAGQATDDRFNYARGYGDILAEDKKSILDEILAKKLAEIAGKSEVDIAGISKTPRPSWWETGLNAFGQVTPSLVSGWEKYDKRHNPNKG